eukprot:1492533-Alexandrium_andersonii.AAC.1
MAVAYFGQVRRMWVAPLQCQQPFRSSGGLTPRAAAAGWGSAGAPAGAAAASRGAQPRAAAMSMRGGCA